MKYLIVIFMFSVFLSPLYAGDGQNAIAGAWLNADGSAVIAVYEKNGKFFGKIIALSEPLDPDTKQPVRDLLNPNKGLRKRKVKGLVIMRDLKYTDDGVWDDGTIYDPKCGDTYSCTAEMSEDGTTLFIKGYVGFSLFGRTTEWTKLSAQEVKKKFSDHTSGK